MNRRSMLTLGLTTVAASMCGASEATPTPARAGTAHSGNPVLGVGGLHHVAIRTRDWDGTLRFYRDALGFRVKLAWKEGSGSVDDKIAANSTQQENDRWAYLDSGDGTCIEVFEDASFQPPPPDLSDPTHSPGGAMVHLGLRTSRIDAVCEHVRRHGATDVGTPENFTLHTTTGQGPVVVRICFLRGPNGEWIELVQNAP